MWTCADLAAVLKKTVRATDSISRYGGDEFVIVLPETRASQGEVLLNRVREAVEKSLRTPAGQPVAVSGGLAEWDPDSRESADQIFRRADTHLYEAKREGRNRVVAHAASPATP